MNLSEGEPLTENIKNFGLCNKSGKFCWASSKRIIVACMSASAIKAIRDEIEMQMQRFRELGFTSNRIDSHDWLLFNLPIWLAVKPLLKQYGFEKTRVACENWIRTKNTLLQMYYKYMANTISSSLQAESSWSGGLRSFERAVDRKIITADTVVEIMTHPDLINGELTDTSNHAEIPFTEVVSTLEKMCSL